MQLFSFNIFKILYKYRFTTPHRSLQKENSESLWDGIPIIKKAAENASENELARDAALIWKKKVAATKRSRKYNQIGKIIFPIALITGTLLYFIVSYMVQMCPLI